MMTYLVLFVLLAAIGWATPFAPRQPFATPTAHRSTTGATTATSSTRLPMVPKFDGDKWVAQSEAELPSAGYGIGKTFLLQGPEPFLKRLFQPDDYEQGVLKFMAMDKCDRNTAQGNMDAYLRNPQDWAFNRMEAEKRGTTINYTKLEVKEIVLVLTWSSIVAALGGRTLYCLVTGVSFVSNHCCCG